MTNDEGVEDRKSSSQACSSHAPVLDYVEETTLPFLKHFRLSLVQTYRTLCKMKKSRRCPANVCDQSL